MGGEGVQTHFLSGVGHPCSLQPAVCGLLAALGLTKSSQVEPAVSEAGEMISAHTALLQALAKGHAPRADVDLLLGSLGEPWNKGFLIFLRRGNSASYIQSTLLQSRGGGQSGTHLAAVLASSNGCEVRRVCHAMFLQSTTTGAGPGRRSAGRCSRCVPGPGSSSRRQLTCPPCGPLRRFLPEGVLRALSSNGRHFVSMSTDIRRQSTSVRLPKTLFWCAGWNEWQNGSGPCGELLARRVV